MSEWKTIKLGDYVESVSKTYKFTDKPVIFLNTSDVLNGKVLNRVYSHPSTLPGQAKKTIRRGDLVYSEIRPANRRFARIDFDADEYVVSTKLMVLRAKGNLTSRYLEFFLTSNDILNFLQTVAEDRSGSFPQITFDNIKDLPLALPAIEEQNKIVETIESLDDKIDLLHRQNQTLEQLAETLFRQWFVVGEDESWSDVVLEDLAKHEKTSVVPGKTPSQKFSHYSLPAFDNGQRPEEQNGSEILSNKYAVKPGRILVSKLNPRTPRIWFILDCTGNAICSTEFQVYHPREKRFTNFLFFLLRSDYVTDTLTSAAGGTSGSHQRVNPEMINQLSLKLPPDVLLAKFDEQVDNWMQKIHTNRQQIETLTTLRDTLLPKLMSGELRVSTNKNELHPA